MCVCMYVCMCVYICIHMCVYICICVYTVYIYIYIYTVCVCIYLYICTYVCVYTYIYVHMCVRLCGKEKTWGKRSRRKRRPRREQLKECRLWFGWPRRLAANGGGSAGGGVGGWESCSFSSAGGFTAPQHQHCRAAFANTPYINCWQSNQAHSSNFTRDKYLRMS